MTGPTQARTVGFQPGERNVFLHLLTACNLACRHCYINPAEHGTATLPLAWARQWLALFARPGPTSLLGYEVTNLVTGAIATGTVTTDLPTTTTLINPYGYMSVGGVLSVVGFATMGLYIETDY